MPRKALTLFSWTTPRTLPDVVFATGPCPEVSLAPAAIALLTAPPSMLEAPSAAPLTKDRRFILVFMVFPRPVTCQPGPFYTFRYRRVQARPQAGLNDLVKQVWLKAITEANGRFGPVRDAIRTGQRSQIIGRRVVHEAPILSAEKHMPRKVEIGPTPVDESSASLRIGTQEIARIKNQPAGASQYE